MQDDDNTKEPGTKKRSRRIMSPSASEADELESSAQRKEKGKLQPVLRKRRKKTEFIVDDEDDIEELEQLNAPEGLNNEGDLPFSPSRYFTDTIFRIFDLEFGPLIPHTTQL
jgi:hypothetical protein